MITVKNMEKVWERYFADYIIVEIINDFAYYITRPTKCATTSRYIAQRFTKPQALRYIMLNDVDFGNHKKLTIEKY